MLSLLPKFFCAFQVDFPFFLETPRNITIYLCTSCIIYLHFYDFAQLFISFYSSYFYNYSTAHIFPHMQSLRTFDVTCVERRDQMEILRVLNCALSNINEP